MKLSGEVYGRIKQAFHQYIMAKARRDYAHLPSVYYVWNLKDEKNTFYNETCVSHMVERNIFAGSHGLCCGHWTPHAHGHRAGR